MNEHFHSELKTDLNLGSSGKFVTNDLVLWAIGQISLQAPDAPVKTGVTRR
ncbi:hypothetical protein ACFOQM_06425 [Paenibacillus sp. GCM10012307]|uniref:Uncharacterized protein n=1 Tax=Paenibacillus roseus TaxID=2798579 RepID=A0A934J5T4_9BACL|nr:hypothetical protein [Paenibacillus roseus]MBJ6360935.1 hypothetical protein [Paenibacillus roseus]